MLRFIALLLVFISSAWITNAQQLLIKNVNIVNVKDGTVEKNMSVLIDGNRIKAVLKNAAAYKGQTVDGTNKYLIPGLWDMHTHNWTAEQFFPLLLANGVTGIRDMFGSMDSIHKWRKEIDAGNILGPVIYASGPIVDGPKPVWPGSVAVSKAEQVAGVIDSVKNTLKADFIKVYSLLPRDVYFKIAEEAKKQGIAFEGHIPNEVSIAEGAKAGQKSQEHLTNLIQESSDSADYFMKINQRVITDTTMKNPVIKLGLVLRTFNPKRLDAIISELVKYGSWICPTLTVNRSIGRLKDSTFTNDARTHYMMPGIVARWNPAGDFRFKALTEEYFQIHQKIFALQLTAVKKMQDAGVKLLAGTDFPNPYCFPGFSLHDELGLMVKAGLTPFQALQTATINPALFFNITKDYGTIEQGKIANLVLLDKNPLENIENTKGIEAVIINGKFLERKVLEAMKTKLWKE